MNRNESDEVSFGWGESRGDRVVPAEEIACMKGLGNSGLGTAKKSRTGAAMREETGEVSRNCIIQSCIKAWQ